MRLRDIAAGAGGLALLWAVTVIPRRQRVSAEQFQQLGESYARTLRAAMGQPANPVTVCPDCTPARRCPNTSCPDPRPAQPGPYGPTSGPFPKRSAPAPIYPPPPSLSPDTYRWLMSEYDRRAPRG